MKWCCVDDEVNEELSHSEAKALYAANVASTRRTAPRFNQWKTQDSSRILFAQQLPTNTATIPRDNYPVNFQQQNLMPLRARNQHLREHIFRRRVQLQGQVNHLTARSNQLQVVYSLKRRELDHVISEVMKIT